MNVIVDYSFAALLFAVAFGVVVFAIALFIDTVWPYEKKRPHR